MSAARNAASPTLNANWPPVRDWEQAGDSPLLVRRVRASEFQGGWVLNGYFCRLEYDTDDENEALGESESWL